MAGKLRDAYDKLVAYLEARSCPVLHCGPLGQEVGRNGQFESPLGSPNGLVRIRIFRERSEEPGPDDHELATLAHEAGHWRSWSEELRPEADYVAAVDHPWPALTPEAKRIILDEETRAWCLGRELLQQRVGELPPEFWAYYEQQTECGLEIYCKRLGLPAGEWKA